MLHKRTTVHVSPMAVPVLVVFITIASPVVLASLLLAALCHELGHYLVLRAFGGKAEAVSVTPFGVRMSVAQCPQLSYGKEMLAVAAGPAVNLLLAVILSSIGNYWELAYLSAGTHLVLGLFNLLPIRPLDGGTLLWLVIAWWTDPFLADRWLRLAGMVFSTFLLLCGVWLWWREGSPFLLLAAAGLFPKVGMRKRTCKRREKQIK